MSRAPRRSSSPIRKPSRPNTFFRNITRAATYPCIPFSFPISPNSCFTDDTALEQLLSHSLPARPSSPPSYPIPPSPASSDVTQFHFLLPDPIQPLNTDTMSTSENNSNRRSTSSSRNNNNNDTNNNNDDTNRSRQSTANPSTSRPNNRRRRPSSCNNNESNSRRRTTSTPNASLRCDICHQYYSRRDNLRAHQRVHTGDRPYQCRFCAQRFRWLGALRNHEAIHERDGDRPLNPPPPGARQPTASSRPSSSATRQNTSDRSTDQNRSRSQHQASAARTHSRQAASSSPRLQRTSPAQHHRSHPNVPDLEFNLDPSHGAQVRSSLLVTEGEPQVSPLYTGSHENWDNILDDTPEDRSRD